MFFDSQRNVLPEWRKRIEFVVVDLSFRRTF